VNNYNGLIVTASADTYVKFWSLLKLLGPQMIKSDNTSTPLSKEKDDKTKSFYPVLDEKQNNNFLCLSVQLKCGVGTGIEFMLNFPSKEDCNVILTKIWEIDNTYNNNNSITPSTSSSDKNDLNFEIEFSFFKEKSFKEHGMNIENTKIDFEKNSVQPTLAKFVSTEKEHISLSKQQEVSDERLVVIGFVNGDVALLNLSCSNCDSVQLTPDIDIQQHPHIFIKEANKICKLNIGYCFLKVLHHKIICDSTK
jgi:hypothetical protein